MTTSTFNHSGESFIIVISHFRLYTYIILGHYGKDPQIEYLNRHVLITGHVLISTVLRECFPPKFFEKSFFTIG